MATFIEFPEANDVLRAAPGTKDHVRDLPIYRQPLPGQEVPKGQHPCVVCCYQFSPEELAEINRTGVIYLMHLGYTHPPVAVHGITPFQQPEG